jgi:1-acyl-sn-glycerol-3-phosphate acyltransferase
MRTLRTGARALAFVAWTLALFTGHLAGRVLLPPARSRHWLARLQRRWARGTLRILGVRVRVEGEPPRPPFFLVANHLSYLDVAVLHACAPCAFVVKSEVARWPWIGRLTRATDHVFVQRARPRDLPRVIGALETRLARGGGVAVFAEATSSPGARVLPFRTPLFAVPARGRWPVHYAALSYRTDPRDPPAESAVCWWGDMEFLPHFASLLALRGIEARVCFGAQPLRGDDAKELARRAHAAVSARLVPVVQTARGALDGAMQNCLAVLGQGIELLEKLDDARYARPASRLGSAGIGPHLRHLVEFFESLLRDLPSGWIDYDQRAREARLESERGAGLVALRCVATRLARLVQQSGDVELHVRQDGCPWARSTLSRELVALHSHAVHHYSLVALLLRDSGHEPPAELGVAPATLAHWRAARA